MKLFLGGARSGKSSRASEVGGGHGEVIYLATGVVTDAEMEERVKRHKEDRPDDWRTIEEETELGEVFDGLKREGFTGAVILDCLGFWVSNLMREKGDGSGRLEEEISETITDDLSVSNGAGFELLIVSNEVGMGVVPPSSAGREFRDTLGRVNQAVADLADEVYLMVAGLEVKLK